MPTLALDPVVSFSQRQTTGSGTTTGIVGIDGVPSGGAFGVGGALLPAPVQIFTLYIAGVDVTQYLKMNTLSAHIPLEGRGSAQFTLSDHTGTYRPAVGADVQYYQGTKRRFGGTISLTTEKFNPGTALYMEVDVACVDYASILDRHIIGKFYPKIFLDGGSLNIMTADIVNRFLSADGITYDQSGAPPLFVGEQTFNWITATDVLNELANMAGVTWRVDAFKVLRYYDLALVGGTPPCPISLSDNDGQWMNMEVERTTLNYRNRQGVRPTHTLTVLWTDTWNGTGVNHAFLTTYVLTDEPTVSINGVKQMVVESKDMFTLPYDFVWLNGGIGVFQNPANTPPSPTDVVTIDYASPLPGIFWEEDDAEIANRQVIEGGSGIWEAVEEGKNVSDGEAATTEALGLLTKYGKPTLTVRFTLPKPLPGLPDIEPGQSIVINTTRPVMNGTIIIDTVEFKEVDKKYLLHTVSAGDHLHRTKGYKYFTKVKARLGAPKDRIVALVVFKLAETIPGIINPGLVTGVNMTIPYDVKKKGIFAYVKFYFKTPPTANDIVIDLKRNGVSILLPDKITIRKGSTATWGRIDFFVSNPLVCNIGDQITIDVVTADATAMDGEVDLVMFA